MQRTLRVLFSRRLLFLIQLVISLIFVLFVLFTHFLPFRFVLLLLFLLVFLSFLFYGLEKPLVKINRYGRKIRRETNRSIITKVVQVVVCACLVFGCFAISSASGFISNITGAKQNTIQYSVVALADSKIDTISDVADNTLGYLRYDDTKEKSQLNQIMTKITNDVNPAEFLSKSYPSVSKQVKALYNGRVDAIVIKEVERVSYKQEESKFNSETKKIKTYEVAVPTAKATSARVTKEPFAVFISGLDTKGEIAQTHLSDVNMVAIINPVTKQILLVSIPRDYYIDIDGTTGKDKLTHSGIRGVECTMNSVANLLGIHFNYYVKLNYTSFINVVDALGGIRIYNPYGEFTTRVGFYVIKEGWNKLNAKKALAFVRERHSFANGDRIRAANQQMMIKAIVKKATSPSSVVKLSAIFNSVAKSMETNMSSSEVRSLINMQIDDMASWDVQSYTLSGTDMRTTEFALTSTSNPKGLYVMQPDETTVNTAKSYISEVMNNELVKIEAQNKNVKANSTANEKYRKSTKKSSSAN